MRGVRPRRDAVARAVDLVSGGRIPAAPPAAELQACDDEEFGVLRPALRELNDRLDELRRDLAYDMCVKLRPSYDQALRQLMDATESISTALKVVFGIRARLHLAGYMPNESVLLGQIPPVLQAIGDPQHSGTSQAWFFAEKLRETGVIRCAIR